MDPQPRIALLDLGQGVVGVDRFRETVTLPAEPIVKLGHAVQRMLDHEEVEVLLLQDRLDVPDGPLLERAVGRYVNLTNAVMPDELLANVGELRPEKRLAP